MIYTPRVCDICEEWGCKADEYRQTMQLSTEAVGPEHKAFWPAMRCAFKASNLKATYKARAEAAERKAGRVLALVDTYASAGWPKTTELDREARRQLDELWAMQDRNQDAHLVALLTHLHLFLCTEDARKGFVQLLQETGQ